MTQLRGNQLIDYKILGLQFKLFACEVRRGGPSLGGGRSLGSRGEADSSDAQPSIGTSRSPRRHVASPPLGLRFSLKKKLRTIAWGS